MLPKTTVYSVLYIVLYTVLYNKLYPGVKIAGWPDLNPEEHPVLTSCKLYLTLYCRLYWTIHCTLYCVLHCTLYCTTYFKLHSTQTLKWLAGCSGIIPEENFLFLPLVYFDEHYNVQCKVHYMKTVLYKSLYTLSYTVLLILLYKDLKVVGIFY